ncbi:MAG: protein-L-isoaspartate(D-aspartate) O-methyltransferase [Solirubrobacteraceae bacterium]
MSDAALWLADTLRSVVADERVLEAIGSVPRDQFVPKGNRTHAYDNAAQPIGYGQTISQPLVVARMLELLELRGTERVLDVGTGSGYHAALLARLAAEVFSIERYAELSAAAQLALDELGVANVKLFVGDGADGLPELAPFDAINIAAATGADVPSELLAQLAPGGRLVAPVGVSDQRLVVITRSHDQLRLERHEQVRFVPLVRGGP